MMLTKKFSSNQKLFSGTTMGQDVLCVRKTGSICTGRHPRAFHESLRQLSPKCRRKSHTSSGLCYFLIFLRRVLDRGRAGRCRGRQGLITAAHFRAWILGSLIPQRWTAAAAQRRHLTATGHGATNWFFCQVLYDNLSRLNATCISDRTITNNGRM